jgi:histidyl-tRNA synthetase
VACVGFGFGDCVIMELLAAHGLLPHLESRTHFVVAPYDKRMLPAALVVAAALRDAGAAVDVLLQVCPVLGLGLRL